jgi:hypothetical protein
MKNHSLKRGRGPVQGNPELRLIDVIADQIQDDERLLDGLGDGTLGLEDVEAWRRRRAASAAGFLDRCGRLIAAMRAQGFSRMMRHVSPRRGARPPRGQAVWGRPGEPR